MMAMDDNNQCNAIVFQTVWFRREDMSDNDQEIRKKINKDYEVRFRMEFFDNFFLFVTEHRCLKENGYIVLPFHPRIIAGLFRINAFGEYPVVMNLVKDVGVIGDIETNWQNVLEYCNVEQTNGYDHDEYKLSGDAFKTELKNQVKNMNVSMDDVNFFLSNKKHANLKCMTIKGKDLCVDVANEDGECNDEDLFANQNDDGNLIAGQDEDDNKNVKFKGQLSLTRNGDNN